MLLLLTWMREGDGGAVLVGVYHRHEERRGGGNLIALHRDVQCVSTPDCVSGSPQLDGRALSLGCGVWEHVIICFLLKNSLLFP